MSGYLIDTSALSAYYYPLHPKHSAVVSEIDALPTEALKLVSVVTLAEVSYGAELAELQGSKYLVELRERVEQIRRHAQLGITHHTSDAYADLKKRIAEGHLKTGRRRLPRFLEEWVDFGSSKTLQLGENDLWIASQAKERDLTVVTTDVDFRAFQAVDADLKMIVI